MSSGGYLDWERLDALDADAFRTSSPYPWTNPAQLIREDGYRRLVETLPDVSQFTSFFDIKRSHGQQSHDRYVLNYAPNIELAEPWRDFVAEITGPRYTAFLRRLFDREFVGLTLHWHYTPPGCSVSPHCDAEHKLGSHIFYFNTEEEWQADWGGETLILDDSGRFHRRSAPGFDAFDRVVRSKGTGNHSLLFQRRGNSWHGVREISCPPDHQRKVFIVVINGRKRSLPRRVLDRLRGKSETAY